MLALAAVPTVLPRVARALGEPAVGVGQLTLPGVPDPRPGALSELMRSLGENTSVVTDPLPRPVGPGDAAMFEQPFAVLCGDRGWAPLEDDAIDGLRMWFREGGFLFVDDASGSLDSAFAASARRDLLRALPGRRFSSVGREHAVFRSFFLVSAWTGRIELSGKLEGIVDGDSTPVLLSTDDLLGALMRGPSGSWALDVVPGGEAQRVTARQLAINVSMYALTTNYKLDAVHVRTLLERMRHQRR
jgi:hypothetical protein